MQISHKSIESRTSPSRFSSSAIHNLSHIHAFYSAIYTKKCNIVRKEKDKLFDRVEFNIHRI